MGDGAASYLSICAGRKDTDSAHKCVGTGIVATLMISVVLTLICEILAAPLMQLFGASQQTMEMAVEYFRSIAAFFPFYLLLNVMNSMIRADGSTVYAMSAMLVGAVINIVLDPIFIFVLKWGIAGAAWATAIGQVVSFAACAVYFLKPKNFVLSKHSFIPDKIVLRKIILMGCSNLCNTDINCSFVAGMQYDTLSLWRTVQIWTGYSDFSIQHSDESVYSCLQYCNGDCVRRTADFRLQLWGR